MGSSNSANKIFQDNEYIKIRDLVNKDNNTLEVLFNTLKIEKGVPINTLSTFLCLPKEKEFDKGILSSFSSKGIINLSQFKSLYFLFKYNGENSTLYKKRYIAELLFKGKDDISYEDYFYNAEKYFSYQDDFKFFLDRYFRQSCLKSKKADFLVKEKFIKNFGEINCYKQNLIKRNSENLNNNEINDEKRNKISSNDEENEKNSVEFTIKIEPEEKSKSVNFFIKKNNSVENTFHKSLPFKKQKESMVIFMNEEQVRINNLINNLQLTPEQLSTQVFDIFFDNFHVKREILLSKNYQPFNEKYTYICDCWNNDSYFRTKSYYDDLEEYYSKMEKKFKKIEQKNQGLFCFSTFQEMMNKVNVHQIVGKIILNYLYKKCLKDIFQFKIFHELMVQFAKAKDEKEQEELIFFFLAYPNKDSIKEETLINLELKDNTSSIMEHEFITINNFTDYILNFKQNIRYSFEKINLIPFIFFDIIPFEPFQFKSCFYYFFSNYQNIDEYIQGSIIKETHFFAVDYQFYLKLQEYMNNTEQSGTVPKFNLTSILNKRKKLTYGLKYNKDFIIYPGSIYLKYLKPWFGNGETDIELKKIKYDESLDEISNLFWENESVCNDEYHKENIGFCVQNDDKIYEIEYFPLTIFYISVKDVYLALKDKTLNEEVLICYLNYLIDSGQLEKNSFVTSRKSKMRTVQNEIRIRINKEELIEPLAFPIFYNDTIQDLASNLSFESQKIADWCLILIDSKLSRDMKNSTFFSYFTFMASPIDNLLNFGTSSIESSISGSNQARRLSCRTYSQFSSVSLQNMLGIPPIGLVGFGNVNALNSALQILINLPYFKRIFLEIKDILPYYYNLKSSRDHSLVDEFIKLIEERWKRKRTIIDDSSNEQKDLFIYDPKSLKQTLSAKSQSFIQANTQDANEILQYLINELSEELNIISKKKNFVLGNDNTEQFNDTELGNIQWANYIRNSASYINGLFSFQMKSIITCAGCLDSKISYEAKTFLSLPIKTNPYINLNIILFRLPIKYRLYYDKVNPDFNEFNLFNFSNSKIKNLELYAEKLLLQKDIPYIKKNINFPLSIEIPLALRKTQTIKDLLDYLRNIKALELERKSELFLGAEFVEETNQINQYKIKNLTTLITYINIDTNNPIYIDSENVLDECFQNNQSIYVYEMLNANGIKELQNYYSIEKSNSIYPTIGNFSQARTTARETISFEVNSMGDHQSEIRTNNETGQEWIIDTNISPRYTNSTNYFVNLDKTQTYNKKNQCNTKLTSYELVHSSNELFDKLIQKTKYCNNDENILSNETFIKYYSDTVNSLVDVKSKNFTYFEYVIKICHTHQERIVNHFFQPFRKEVISFFYDILLVNNTSSYNYTAEQLYDYIWEKYKRYLRDPNIDESKLWWKREYKNKNYQFCYPFSIKICFNEKNVSRCARCPWYKFCTGCILNPFETKSIILECKSIIEVEWCNRIVKNELMENLLQYSIKDEKEFEISDGETNTISKDKMEQFEPSNDLIDYLQILINPEQVSLSKECNNCHCYGCFEKTHEFIKVSPIIIITLQRFKVQKMYKTKIDTLIKFPLTNLVILNNEYDLYGIINHTGSIENGHYTSIIKIDTKWILFDDSRYEEIKNKKELISEKAYILVYISKKPAIEISDIYKMMESLNHKITERQLSNILSEKKSNKSKIVSDYFFEGEPVRVKDEEGYISKIKGEKITIKFTSGNSKTVSKKNIEKMLMIQYFS